MARTLDQFVIFTTDSVGIERILRLFQALAQVFASCALPFELLLTLIATWTGREASPELTLAILVSLKQRFNLARRFFRIFRFVESFRDAQKLYSSVQEKQGSPASPSTRVVGADVWLDIFAKTFNGMYLLLETSTMLDVLDIDGLAVWDRATRTSINIEAQRFWLFALVCGMLSGLWKMFCIMAYAPVPQVVAVGGGAAADGGVAEKEKTQGSSKDEATALKEEQARLREVAADREARRQQTRTKMYKLGRGALACAFDITIPGAVVGWLDLDDGTVGSAMVVSTILTGLAVWEKCGEQL
ncbi:peroxisomal biogenesis factor 11 [Microdochium trichocladiopsis]|uniref:Peroxisomal biogenesis factor 11 n=1 Tax=Microdochium trichocladiopsis TaxID=1682393 RepID=A0A9P8Y189_9PEZI|nr:peroxisomal biogenesis factor 11 [Microdochium trichocladiopsis]KAH7028033.1 peroxisomal biogenesis factor 11 [Microdochium trichocladiopsis]